jgi:hypothetical protein
MKHIRIIFILSLGLFFGQCSKDDESYKTYPVPEWSIESPEEYPNSFTAIIRVPDNIDVYSEDNDKVGAFIGEECRGIGNLVKSEDGIKRVYYFTIRGSDTETGEIVFKYYNAKLSYMYQSTNSVTFEIDGTYGTYDSPIEIELINI